MDPDGAVWRPDGCLKSIHAKNVVQCGIYGTYDAVSWKKRKRIMRGCQKNVIGLQSDFEVRLSIILVERRGAGIAGGIVRAGFSEPGLRIKARVLG